tara:strand:+ start:3887 stop:5878 length:1992 start_codon:yes stop_codon:yes gene_type:complete
MAEKTIALQIIIEADKANSVEELTTSIKQLETELGKTKKGSQRFKELETSIKKTKGKLDTTTRSMGKLDTATKKVGTTSKTMTQGFAGATSVLGLFGNAGAMVQAKIMGIQNAVNGLSFKSIGKGLTNFIGLARGITTSSGALKIFKIALASTGIGLLIVALGSLVAYFTRTQQGIDKVKVVTAQLSSVFGNIIDRLSKFGEGLLLLFNGKVQDGLKKMGTAFNGMGKEIKKDVELTGKLERQVIAMEVADKKFQLRRAMANKEIAKSEAIYNDETKSVKERTDAMKMAMNVEESMMAGAKSLLKQRITNKEKELGINESMRTDNFELIDLRIKMENLEKSSFNTKKRLQSQLTGLDRKSTAEGKAAATAAQTIIDDKAAKEKEFTDKIKEEQRKRQLLLLNDRDKERQTIKNKYDDDKLKFEKQGDVLKELKKTFDLENKQLNKQFVDEDIQAKNDANDKQLAADQLYLDKKDAAEELAAAKKAAREKKELDRAKAILDNKIDLASGGFNALADLAHMFADGQDAGSKKAFENNKAISIATAIIDTIVSAQKAYASQLQFDATSPIRAAIAAAIATAGGLARVAAIRRTTYQSTTANVPTPSGSIPTGGNNNIDPTRFGSTILGGNGRGNRNPIVVKNVISVLDINKANQNIGQAQTRSVVK